MREKCIIRSLFTVEVLVGLSVGSIALAQNVEQVYLKDGSVLEGYISEQIPGKSIVVTSSKATLVVNADSLQATTTRSVNLAELPEAWQDEIFRHKPDSLQRVTLTTLSFAHRQYKDVYVIEQGALIKFIDMKPGKFAFAWSDLYKTVKNLRPDNQFSGIEDILILEDGKRYAGQVTEQYPGKNIKILTKDGAIVSVNASQVAQMQSVPISKELTFWQQACLLDRLYLKNHATPLEGIIIRRVMDKDLTLMASDGSTQLIPLKEVAEYQKSINPDYTALFDRHLAEGEVLLNGHAAWFASLPQHGPYMVLGEDVSVKVIVGDTITLEARLPYEGTSITLIKAYQKNLAELEKRSKSDKIRDVFTYRDLVEKALPYSRVTTPLGNTKVEFKVLQPGDYVVSIQGKDGYIIIHVDDTKD